MCDDVNTADVLEFPINSNVPEIPGRQTVVTCSQIIGVETIVTGSQIVRVDIFVTVLG